MIASLKGAFPPQNILHRAASSSQIMNVNAKAIRARKTTVLPQNQYFVDDRGRKKETNPLCSPVFLKSSVFLNKKQSAW